MITRPGRFLTGVLLLLAAGCVVAAPERAVVQTPPPSPPPRLKWLQSSRGRRTSGCRATGPGAGRDEDTSGSPATGPFRRLRPTSGCRVTGSNGGVDTSGWKVTGGHADAARGSLAQRPGNGSNTWRAFGKLAARLGWKRVGVSRRISSRMASSVRGGCPGIPARAWS